jgi:hypothetical protein
MLAALRPHQWVKNLLVLLPLFLAHEWAQLGKLWLALVGLAAFSGQFATRFSAHHRIMIALSYLICREPGCQGAQLA